MEMNKQPEALRLAERLDLYSTGDEHQRDVEQAAAELRRLNEVNAELVNVLRNILWHRKPGGYPSAYQREIEVMAGLAIDKATGEQQ
jgi:hypothetical protein